MKDKFNVLIVDFNTNKVIPYDVLPYFENCYKELKRSRRKDKKMPVTDEDWKSFIKEKSTYLYYAKCEYELLIYSWPGQSYIKKMDVHYQVMMNIDIIIKILKSNLKIQ
jgi:hypothetical protein